MADFNESLHNAAATPGREAPLSAIETRLRRRRLMRRGAAGVCALALVGAISGGIALSADDGPTVRTVGQATTPTTLVSLYANLPSASVTLPEGWVQSPVKTVGIPAAILFAGTEAALEPMTSVKASYYCTPESTPEVASAAYIVVSSYIGTGPYQTPTGRSSSGVEPIDRPADFSAEPTQPSSACGVNDVITSTKTEYVFRDQGYVLWAAVILKNETPELRAEAYAVLNSLVVTPITPEPEPVTTTVPTATAPESADTAAIALAFETWIGTPPPDFEGLEAVIEDFASIKATAQEAASLVGNPQCYTGHVDAITRIDEDDADVIFSFFCDGRPAVPSGAHGRAVKINGVWMVSRDTVCETFAIGQARCPARR